MGSDFHRSQSDIAVHIRKLERENNISLRLDMCVGTEIGVAYRIKTSRPRGLPLLRHEETLDGVGNIILLLGRIHLRLYDAGSVLTNC